MQIASSVILSDNIAKLFLFNYNIYTFNLYLISCIGSFTYIFLFTYSNEVEKYSQKYILHLWSCCESDRVYIACLPDLIYISRLYSMLHNYFLL